MKIRNLLFTQSRLQRRYMRLIEISLAVPALIVGGCLYYLVFYMMAEQLAIPEFIAVVLFPVVRKINIILLIVLPIVFIVLFWIGLIVSHKLAGPVDRLNRELSEIARGDHKRRIKLRKGDELEPAAESVNKILDKLEGKGN
ncbi:MAG: methyl-accepting chemotaxis protein [Candidatus Omnitrophica bacterium]|nr:methyl-accepting chemotaxis protein [Candidatus Omnitrophota bacterium]